MSEKAPFTGNYYTQFEDFSEKQSKLMAKDQCYCETLK